MHSESNGHGPPPPTRHDWTHAQINALFDLPFNDLLFRAHLTHRQHFDPNTVQLSTLLSIKTGACPEDCKYCPQSARYHTGVEPERLLDVQHVVAKARLAKAKGATRFCMGAAWRTPPQDQMDALCNMISQVKSLGLETCMTLGMLETNQAQQLAKAGLDFYNHNLDTSPEYYTKIITTRTYKDRLETLKNVRAQGMKVCCGGIIGMNERLKDRIELLRVLSNFPEHPESVPINLLVRVPGTPLEDAPDLDPFEFIKTVAVARILMPTSYVRLSAGRRSMSEQTQALCFFAGANSVFYGEKLLTTPNATARNDQALFEKLGLRFEAEPTPTIGD